MSAGGIFQLIAGLPGGTPANPDTVTVIQNAAANYGGTCRQRFTAPASGFFEGSGSLDWLLTNQWVVTLAAGGSFWSGMLALGRVPFPLLMALRVEMSHGRAAVFANHQIRHVQQNPTTGSPTATDPLLADNVTAAINSVTTLRHHPPRMAFVTIDLSGPGGIHHIVAQVTRNQVLLFDPHFGEFAFPSEGNLGRWFGFLVRTSSYKNDFGQVASDLWSVA